LIDYEERQREKEYEFHSNTPSFRASRSEVDESRCDAEDYFTRCLDFARHDR
jgi:hypothetical protein